MRDLRGNKIAMIFRPMTSLKPVYSVETVAEPLKLHLKMDTAARRRA
jgi:ABC-type microcin C transport system duplicated ATPase subunit YejF